MIMDSEYVFDNLKPIDQLRAKPVKLIQKKFHQISGMTSIMPTPMLKALTASMSYGMTSHR